MHEKKFYWKTEAFGRRKHMLVLAPILARPDFTKTFVLDTDARNHAIGAVLSQKIRNKENVIVHANRTFQSLKESNA